jgi:hypothetical protein
VKKINYFIQGGIAYFICGIFKVLSIDKASAFGGFLGRHLLYYTGGTKVARSNLDKVYSNITKSEKKKIIKDMWNNLGRLVGEYVHLEQVVNEFGLDDSSKRVNVKGMAKVKKIVDSKETPGLGAKINNLGWQKSWLGRDKNYEFNKSVDAFAGATISPRAVYRGIKKTLAEFEKVVK